MRRTLLCGLAVATIMTASSWADMAKRAAAKHAAADRGVTIAVLPPAQSNAAY